MGDLVNIRCLKIYLLDGKRIYKKRNHKLYISCDLPTHSQISSSYTTATNLPLSLDVSSTVLTTATAAFYPFHTPLLRPHIALQCPKTRPPTWSG